MPPQALTLSTDQPPATNDARPKRLRVGRKLRAVIDRMVFDGEQMDEAAANEKITTRAVRKAFEKRHVLAYLRMRKDVFRASVSAKNIRRLGEIRDAADNMPAVNAIKALEQIDEHQQAHGTRAPAVPGFVIVLHERPTPMPHVREIEAKSLETQALGHIERVGTDPDDAPEDP